MPSSSSSNYPAEDPNMIINKNEYLALLNDIKLCTQQLNQSKKAREKLQTDHEDLITRKDEAFEAEAQKMYNNLSNYMNSRKGYGVMLKKSRKHRKSRKLRKSKKHRKSRKHRKSKKHKKTKKR